MQTVRNQTLKHKRFNDIDKLYELTRSLEQRGISYITLIRQAYVVVEWSEAV